MLIILSLSYQSNGGEKKYTGLCSCLDDAIVVVISDHLDGITKDRKAKEIIKLQWPRLLFNAIISRGQEILVRYTSERSSMHLLIGIPRLY